MKTDAPKDLVDKEADVSAEAAPEEEMTQPVERPPMLVWNRLNEETKFSHYFSFLLFIIFPVIGLLVGFEYGKSNVAYAPDPVVITKVVTEPAVCDLAAKVQDTWRYENQEFGFALDLPLVIDQELVVTTQNRVMFRVSDVLETGTTTANTFSIALLPKEEEGLLWTVDRGGASPAISYIETGFDGAYLGENEAYVFTTYAVQDCVTEHQCAVMDNADQILSTFQVLETVE